ncbi:hypothetical protein [Mesorhizobium sp. IMUNJ 23232]|uniref:hypothetical protein n=1 Tax=Mesorhizobium sp. IMUNJ 23232 TaxID=3376064 RepID=UPI00378BAEBA
MTDIEIAPEAAALAQVNPTVAKMIRSGEFDAWPNVQGALNAIRLAQGDDAGRKRSSPSA